MMLLGTALMVLSHGSEARTYKWVDEDGTTHYSQNKPPGRSAEELSVYGPRTASTESNDECASLACRAGRLEAERREKEEAARKIRDAAARAARVPVFPTKVEETDDEKITRLVAECKSSRGSKCDSHEEKRRMLLQNVDLTQTERRALRGLTPSQQRRVLLQRIPKEYRSID
jgi:ATPase subunit of ABC transporter with duplicated ATPase domains